MWRMRNMIPRRRRLALADGPPPLLPRKKLNPRSLAKVREHLLGIPAQSHRRRRHDVKTFTDSVIGLIDRQLERLRDIISVHMMHRLESLIGQHHYLAARDPSEHVKAEMSRRIDRIPPGPNEMPRMQNRRPRIPAPSGVEQKFFDRCLLDSVIA